MEDAAFESAYSTWESGYYNGGSGISFDSFLSNQWEQDESKENLNVSLPVNEEAPCKGTTQISSNVDGKAEATKLGIDANACCSVAKTSDCCTNTPKVQATNTTKDTAEKKATIELPQKKRRSNLMDKLAQKRIESKGKTPDQQQQQQVASKTVETKAETKIDAKVVEEAVKINSNLEEPKTVDSIASPASKTHEPRVSSGDIVSLVGSVNSLKNYINTGVFKLEKNGGKIDRDHSTELKNIMGLCSSIKRYADDKGKTSLSIDPKTEVQLLDVERISKIVKSDITSAESNHTEKSRSELMLLLASISNISNVSEKYKDEKEVKMLLDRSLNIGFLDWLFKDKPVGSITELTEYYTKSKFNLESITERMINRIVVSILKDNTTEITTRKLSLLMSPFAEIMILVGRTKNRVNQTLISSEELDMADKIYRGLYRRLYTPEGPTPVNGRSNIEVKNISASRSTGLHKTEKRFIDDMITFMVKTEKERYTDSEITSICQGIAEECLKTFGVSLNVASNIRKKGLLITLFGISFGVIKAVVESQFYTGNVELINSTVMHIMEKIGLSFPYDEEEEPLAKRLSDLKLQKNVVAQKQQQQQQQQINSNTSQFCTKPKADI